MDQAMGDLQTQLEELKKAWDNESLQRIRLQAEIEGLRAQNAALAAVNGALNSDPNQQKPLGETLKRAGEDADEKDGKRQRME